MVATGSYGIPGPKTPRDPVDTPGTLGMGPPYQRPQNMGGSFHVLEWHRMVLEALVKNFEEMVTEKHSALRDWPFGASNTEPFSLLLPCFEGKEFQKQAGPISVNKNILLDSAQSCTKYMTYFQERAIFISPQEGGVRLPGIEHAIIVQRQGCIVAPRVSDCNSHGHVVDGALAAKHQRKGHQDESWLLVLPLSTFTNNSELE